MKYTELKTTEEAIEALQSGKIIEAFNKTMHEWQRICIRFDVVQWDKYGDTMDIIPGRRFRLVEPDPKQEYERWELDTSYQQIRFVDPAKNGGYRTASACIDNGGVFEFEDGTVGPICTRMILGSGHTGLWTDSDTVKTETAVACRFYKR